MGRSLAASQTLYLHAEKWNIFPATTRWRGKAESRISCRTMSNSAVNARSEEFANFLTHGGGLLLALGGAGVLLHSAGLKASNAVYLSCTIYSATLVSVYAASTLSHSFQHPGRREFFRSVDQGVIFLFIAGSFTPLAVVYLQDQPWWMMLPAMWVLAVTGFCSKVFWTHRVNRTAVTHYLALGWMPVAASWPILQALPRGGIVLCVAGGLCYTLGTLFLKLDEKVPFFHSIWHLFVIGGSACHFLVILYYVIPQPSTVPV